jgi:hypothetical protein
LYKDNKYFLRQAMQNTAAAPANTYTLAILQNAQEKRSHEYRQALELWHKANMTSCSACYFSDAGCWAHGFKHGAPMADDGYVKDSWYKSEEYKGQ